MEKNIRILKKVGKTQLIPPRGSDQKSKEVDLYKFDIRPPKRPWQGYRLPDKYEKLLEEAHFIIDRKALDTIEYLLNEAPVQRYMPLYRHYDTSVRETLMELGAEFLHKAVYLISDYYFDKEKGYYSRMSDGFLPKYVIASLAIYKYWCGRTGRGLQWGNAGFNKSVYRYNEYKNWLNYYHVAQEIKNYEKIQAEEFDVRNIEKFGNNSSTVVGLEDIFPPEKYGVDVTFEVEGKLMSQYIESEGENELICINNAKNKFYKMNEDYFSDNPVQDVEFAFEKIIEYK